ncbi:MAG: FecR family protein [Bacteroidota bacterium]
MEMPHYHAYYETYTEEQLAADEYFQQWVLAEDKRNNHFWKTFIEIYPEKFDTVLNGRRLVKELAANPYSVAPLTVQEKSLLKESIYQQLAMQDSSIVQMASFRQSKSRYAWMTAAVMIFLVIGIYLFLRTPLREQTFLVEQTGAKEIKEVTLPDSSVVVLNANSSLKFSSQFTEDSVRMVYLEGNAYFKVKRTAKLTPFIVHADELNIRVTGTEFNVNARTKATDIVLTSGKVNVTVNGDNKTTAYMKAGERLMLDTVSSELVSSVANTEIYTSAWKNKEWHFQETTMENIAELIKEYYGMEMVFTNKKQKKMMITAIVSVNDFSTLVNVIAKTLNIKIKEERNQLLIY